MSADQIADISTGVREVLAGGPDTCAQFTIANDPARWLQFTAESINAAYPHRRPLSDFPQFFEGREVLSFQIGLFVTLGHTSTDVRETAEWIDRYFEEVLGCGAEYDLDLELEEL